MSRSWKKTPVYKIGAHGKLKRVHQRRMRRRIKAEPTIPSGGQYRITIEKWDVVDYRIYQTVKEEFRFENEMRIKYKSIKHDTDEEIRNNWERFYRRK